MTKKSLWISPVSTTFKQCYDPPPSNPCQNYHQGLSMISDVYTCFGGYGFSTGSEVGSFEPSSKHIGRTHPLGGGHSNIFDALVDLHGNCLAFRLLSLGGDTRRRDPVRSNSFCG